MEQKSQLSRQRFMTSSTAVGERVTAFLRRRHPVRTIDNVVADLAPWDIKHATVARMLDRQSSPGTILWLALIWAYGPEFLSEVHPAKLHWVHSAARAERQREIEAKIDALKAELEAIR